MNAESQPESERKLSPSSDEYESDKSEDLLRGFTPDIQENSQDSSDDELSDSVCHNIEAIPEVRNWSKQTPKVTNTGIADVEIEEESDASDNTTENGEANSSEELTDVEETQNDVKKRKTMVVANTLPIKRRRKACTRHSIRVRKSLRDQ